MKNVRDFLGFSRDFNFINREERYLTAILYHLLLSNNNIETFLSYINCRFPIVKNEFAIYYEYTFLRDLWNHISYMEEDITKQNERKVDLILNFLMFEDPEKLKKMKVKDFNKYFGIGNASSKYIQMPGRWSIKGLSAREITSNKKINKEEFLKICKFKWAFNVKPDIVIHTSYDSAVCIEAKFESYESLYPDDKEEIKIFKHKGLEKVKQTEVQKYLMNELLGIRTQSIMIVKNRTSISNNENIYTWDEVFNKLNTKGCYDFISEKIQTLKW